MPPSRAASLTGSVGWGVMFAKADRAVLRKVAPVLWLGAAVIAFILLTEVASSMGARRQIVVTLATMVVVTPAAFLTSMMISTYRLISSVRR